MNHHSNIFIFQTNQHKKNYYLEMFMDLTAKKTSGMNPEAIVDINSIYLIVQPSVAENVQRLFSLNLPSPEVTDQFVPG